MSEQHRDEDQAVLVSQTPQPLPPSRPRPVKGSIRKVEERLANGKTVVREKCGKFYV